jgi:hypothetical protein
MLNQTVNDIPAPTLIPEGKYVFEIADYKEDLTQGGSDRVTVSLTNPEPLENQDLTDVYTQGSTFAPFFASWALWNFIKAAAPDQFSEDSGESFENMLREMIGQRVVGTIVHKQASGDSERIFVNFENKGWEDATRFSG